MGLKFCVAEVANGTVGSTLLFVKLLAHISS